MLKKDKNYYLSLPYNYITKQVVNENETYYIGRVLELDGCQSDGKTVEELYKNLDAALELYIENKLNDGFDIPEPVEVEKFSGKFNLRLPKTLHQRLSIEAEKEGVSLNQYAVYKLAK